MCKITDKDNLYLAYWKARMSKEARIDVIEFSKHLDDNLDNIRSILLGDIPFKCHYREFTIFDPKKRTICAAPFEHRVIQHAIINICGPLIDKRLIYDTYACRKGKGQYKAIDKARKLHHRYKWCVKLDIRKFFDSIDHLVLKRLLYHTFKEESILRILFDIIDGYDSGNTGKGIPIGNLTSQYFANYYLDGLDKYIKETLRVKGYVRYMDDMLLYGDDTKKVSQWITDIKNHVENNLKLDFKVVDKRRTTKSVSFLGYRIYNNHIKLNTRSKLRYRHKLYAFNYIYQKGVLSQNALKSHLLPLIAFINKAKSYKFASKINSRLIWD